MSPILTLVLLVALPVPAFLAGLMLKNMMQARYDEKRMQERRLRQREQLLEDYHDIR